MPVLLWLKYGFILVYLAHAGVRPAVAQDDDPFFLLFGEEEEASDQGADAAAGYDDLTLVRLQLRKLELSDALPAYQTADGICPVFSDLVAAFEFPIEVDADMAAGWYIEEKQTFSADFENSLVAVKGTKLTIADNQLMKTPDGWCVTLGGLSQIFPIQFAYDQFDLAILATPEMVLPIEAKLERAVARKRLSERAKPEKTAYPEFLNSYRWLSFPTADISISFDFDDDQGLGNALSIHAAGEVLKSSAQIRTSSDAGEGGQTTRLTLERTLGSPSSDAASQPRVRVGDISIPATALVRSSETGRGAFITNQSEFVPELFDTTTIRGPLPSGWEAELYDGEMLVSFVTGPDANGDYVFPDIVLTPGYNRYEVRLFGPHGEKRTEERKFFVGGDMMPENEISYGVGILQPDAYLFDQGDADATETTLYGAVAIGLREWLTMYGDYLARPSPDTEHSFGAGLQASVRGTATNIKLATNGRGTSALEVSAQRRLTPTTNLSATFRDFGDLESGVSGRGDRRAQRNASIRLSSSLSAGTRIFPLRTEAEWLQYENGDEQRQIETRISGSVLRTRLVHALSFGRSMTGGDVTQSLNGSLLATRNINSVRLRAALNYDASERVEFTSASLSVRKRFKNRFGAQLNVEHAAADRNTSASVSLTKNHDKVAVSMNASLDSQGDWGLGVQLGLSLYHNPQTDRLAVGPRGMAQAGTIVPMVFEDGNGNRLRDETEGPLKDFAFNRAGRTLAEVTDEEGRAILSGLSANQPLVITFDESSLADPYLIPATKGYALKLRPGQVVEMTVPVLPTGDADGVLLVQNGEHQTPASGVRVEVTDAEGAVVASTVTEFDGYFYVAKLPLGPLVARVAKEDLASVGAAAAPISFELTAENPSRIGVKLLIFGNSNGS